MGQKGLGKGLGALLSVFDEDEQNGGIDSLFETPKKPVEVKQGGFKGGVDLSELEKVVKKSSPSNVSRGTTASGAQSLGVTEIEVGLIDSNANQPRKEFDHEKLMELAESIKVNGVIQPVVLCPVGSRYMIVAGERRWRASKIAGLKKIPAVVRQMTAAQVAEIAIIENLQREDLNDIELARGIKALMYEFSLTQEQVSVRLGKNRSAIAHTLRLLALPDEVIKMIEDKKLSAGHGRCLVSVADKKEVVRLAKMCVDRGLSVRELERIVQGGGVGEGAGSAIASKKGVQSLELREMTKELINLFKTKVDINGTSEKGRVVIEYFNKQDLLRIRKHIIDVNKLVSVDDEVRQRVSGFGLGVKKF